MANLELIINLIIIALLLPTIIYAYKLNKNLKELENYQKYLPAYWNKILELQSKTDRLMKKSKRYQEWINK